MSEDTARLEHMLALREIEAGLKNDEFFLEYQPIVELDGGRWVGAEALSRWRRRSGIIAQPVEFMPRIEETLLSGYLTHWLLDEIAKDFLSWVTHHDAYISFNVPPDIMGRGGLYYVAEKAGLIAQKHRFVIEITEQGILDRIGVEAINAGVDLGFRFALDDVGSEANPIVLSRCHMEMIKVDRALVSQVRPGKPLPAALQSIATLAKASMLAVVAEGVETADQADALKQAGITLAQGFYFSPPLSAAAFKGHWRTP